MYYQHSSLLFLCPLIVLAYSDRRSLATEDESCSSIITSDRVALLPKLLPGFADIKASCGELCNVSQKELHHHMHQGPFFKSRWRNVDCDDLFRHDFDSMVPKFKQPLSWHQIPYEAQKVLNWGGLFAVDPAQNHAKDLTDFVNSTWTRAQIEKYRQQIKAGIAIGNYGAADSKLIERNLHQHMDIKDKHVLVIGSERPWLEAYILEAGARKVTTLEYKPIRSEHPQIATIMPQEFDEMYKTGSRFDTLVSFSSLEHSGLGRYGDQLNPWGDIITMAKAWCILKPKGEALVGIPVWGTDVLKFNAARVYSRKTLPYLFTNWRQLHSEAIFSKANNLGTYQPVFILHKVSSQQELYS